MDIEKQKKINNSTQLIYLKTLFLFNAKVFQTKSKERPQDKTSYLEKKCKKPYFCACHVNKS